MGSLKKCLIVLPLFAATGCRKAPPPEPVTMTQPFQGFPNTDLSQVPGTPVLPGSPMPRAREASEPPEDLSSPLAVAHPSFSPDSRLVAMFGGRVTSPKLQIRDVKGKILAQAKVTPDMLGPIAWKSDSQRVILNGQSAQVFKVARQGKTVRLTEVVSYRVPAGHAFHPRHPELSLSRAPAGKTTKYRIIGTEISAAHQMGALREATFTRPYQYRIEIFDLKTPARRIPLTNMVWGADGASFSPAGPARLLVCESQDGRQWQYAAWDLQTRKRLWQRDFVGLGVRAKWSRDGRNVLISRIEKSVAPARHYPIFPAHEPMEWLDAGTGKTLRKISAQRTQHLTDFIGNRIYSFGTESARRLNPATVSIINPQNGKTETALYPSRLSGFDTGGTLAFSPDGQQIIFARTHDPVLSWRVADLKRFKEQPESWYDEPEYDEEYE